MTVVAQSTRGLPAPTNKWWVAAAVGFGALMSTIDTSIVNVALPHIRGSVGATLSEITWISISYIVAMVVVMPLTGFLGALFGQKRVYLASLGLFLLGSMLCGMARTLPALIAFRALQGLGGGALQPTQQAILRQTFPREEQGMAMAMFAMVVMVGPAIGPVLGGWLTDEYSWPWIFYVNLPVGALGIAMVWRFVREPEDVRRANRARAAAQRHQIDWPGIALLIAGVSALQYVLEEGQSKDWFDSEAIVLGTFVAATALAAFVIRELAAPAPVVNLRLFRDPTFAAATAIGGLMFGMLMASMFLLPVYLQEVLGYDATQSGLALLPRTLAMMALTPIVGRLYNRVPPALTIATGVALFLVGSWQLSTITLDTSIASLIAPLAITGAGFACLFVPLTTAALSNTPRAALADAAGLNSFVRQIGGSIGLTLFAMLLSTFTTQAAAGLAPNVSPLRAETVAALSAVGPPGMALLRARIVEQATVLAFEKAFLLQGIAFLAVLPLLLLLRVRRAEPSAPVEVSVE